MTAIVTPPQPESPAPHSGLYFGWVIVAASTILTLLTVGMRMGIGPFMLPMAQDLGFSRSLLSSIVAIGMLCYGLGMPAAGWLVARKGTRTVLLIGTVIVVLACIWTVNARTPWSFFWAYGVVLSLGLAFTSPVAVTPMISRWFTRQRGMALFFLSTGSMAGIAVMTPVFTYTISHWGWQNTLLGFAAVFALIISAMAFGIVRDDAPENTDLSAAQIQAKRAQAAASPAQTLRPASSLSFTQAIATAPFWQIFLGLFACGFSMNLLGTHGVPMLMDHGFDAGSSAGGIGLIGFVAIFSTLGLGKLSDMVPRRYILAAIGGIVWAGSIAASSAILGDLYGIKLVGLLYGWAYLGHQIGAMISSWLGGWAFEQFGTHWIAFGAAALLLVAAAGVSLKLPTQLTTRTSQA